VIARSPILGIYDELSDRESAFEILKERAARRAEAEEERQMRLPEPERAAPRRSSRETPVEAAVKSFARTMARELGRSLVRGILGSVRRGR
jgi:hypothetical protein